MLTLQASHSKLLAGSEPHSLWAQVELTAPEALNQREGVDVGLILDCSGSMGFGPGSPLDHAFAAARYLTERLSGEDRLSIILYGSGVQVLHPLCNDHGLALERLKRPQSLGMTALWGGVQAGMEQLSDPKRRRRLFLLSDGLANVGEQRADRMTGLIKDACQNGLQLASFGMGDRYDEDLLEALAEAGSGGYHYLASADEAASAFQQELEEMLSVSLREVRVEVRPRPGVELKQVLGGELQANSISLGELPASSVRRVLLQLESAGQPGPLPLLEVSLHCLGEDDRSITREAELKVEVSEQESEVLAGVDHIILARVAEMQAAAAQSQAAQLAELGDFAAARSLVSSSHARMGELLSSSPLAVREQLSGMLGGKMSELEVNSHSLASSASYNPEAAKAMKYSSYRTRTGRTPSQPEEKS